MSANIHEIEYVHSIFLDLLLIILYFLIITLLAYNYRPNSCYGTITKHVVSALNI